MKSPLTKFSCKQTSMKMAITYDLKKNKYLHMKTIFFLVFIIPQLFFSQKIKNSGMENSEINANSGKQYVYKVNLYRINNVSYPNTKVKLKLMQNAAILDENAMLYPKAMTNHNGLANVCPIVLFGYKNSLFNTDNSCKVLEKSELDFTNEAQIGTRISMNIPTNKLTSETKLVLGIYGAEITLPNGTSKKLKKANVRSFRLIDMDFSVRNYIKYEVDIDGARITLEYVIERATVN